MDPADNEFHRVFESILTSVVSEYPGGVLAPSTPQSPLPDPVVPWVLCIDDDADFSQAVKLRLESRGVAVVRAYEGTEGFHSAFSNRASAILLDYHLPNGQGDYVLRRLKETPSTRSIPVIVVTGAKSGALERNMLNAGAERVLSKPLDFDQLCRELARHVPILCQPAPGFSLPESKLVY